MSLPCHCVDLYSLPTATVAFPKATWQPFPKQTQSHNGLCTGQLFTKDLEAFPKAFQPFPKGCGVSATKLFMHSPSSGMDLVRNRCTRMRYFGATLRESLVEDTPIDTDDVSLLICPTKSSALKHHWALGFKCVHPQTM